ncbi:hypothetical protein Tco_1000330 [Tanacetum coccineum]
MERNWMYDMNITDPEYVNGVQSFLIAAESNRVAMEDIEIVHVRNTRAMHTDFCQLRHANSGGDHGLPLNVVRYGASAGPSNVVARCAINEITEFSGRIFDSLMCLRDSRRMRNDKLMGLNEMIYEAEEKINTKEAHLEITEATIKSE